ncbi:MAG: M3 family metallopeptidase [Prevotella sp.]|nr:M3 family metallopeptidase [Prevotella sp.]MCM1074707.1 M3 family metallopeptidase [Ruminococcus sp.]
MKKLFGGCLATLAIMSASDVGARTNPFLEQWNTPRASVPFDKIIISDYEEAIKAGIAQQNQEVAAICNQRSTPTFENTIKAYERSGSILYNVVLTLTNLEGALGTDEIQKVVSETTPLLSEHTTNLMLNEALWNRIKFVYENMDKDTSLTPEDRRLTEEVYKDFAENGANLEGEAREKYRRLSTELSNLTVKFGQNLTNDMKNPERALWLTTDQLSGLPESAIAAARAEAAEALKAAGKPDDGSQYLFTVFFPSYSPLIKYLDNRELREKMYYLYNTRNYGGEFDNTQLLKDIANVRMEIAQLFGYSNYADYVLNRRMAKNAKNVRKLLDDLCNAYKVPMENEIKEITEFAQQTEGSDFKLEPWDYSYWSDKLKNAKYSFNDEDMKPYFEVNNVIKGVFGLAHDLYGYNFKENKDIVGYHPDVTAYDVTDSKGGLIGVLYTDFFYRPGKAPGAWMTEYRGEYIDDNGERVIPLISIVMNFTKPNGNEPTLMTPYEVETFLHEFGHAIHGLSGQAKYQSQGGTNVYRDFVELFSQFNENYLTQKKFLDTFAVHYKTGKKMPKSLIDKFIKASQYGAAYSCMRQLSFGNLDMAYHSITEPLRASQDIEEFEADAIEPVKVFDSPKGTLLSPAFGHIFSGGYASGYYGYKWAEELDADAFAAFLEAGNIYDKKTAAKFLKMLQAGNTVDPEVLYEEFRGRPATVDAMLVRDGIKK